MYSGAGHRPSQLSHTVSGGLKGSLGGDLSSRSAFLSKAKTASLSEAVVATVTVPQTHLWAWKCCSPDPSSPFCEELAVPVFSTTGTRCFFSWFILKANSSSVEKASLFSRPLSYVSKLFMRKKKWESL